MAKEPELNKSNDLKTFNSLVTFALLLSVITILYNIAEGLFSVYFGLNDETLALFGFGLDSFVEVISGVGIFHMIVRMKRNPISERDGFERTALKITGFSFYLLFAGLIIASLSLIINDVKPETTMIGIIVSIISIVTMYALVHY